MTYIFKKKYKIYITIRNYFKENLYGIPVYININVGCL